MFLIVQAIGRMLQKLLIVPVCSNYDVDINDHIRAKILGSLGLCFMLSSILVFGSVFAALILPAYAQGEYVAFPETVSVSNADLPPTNFILKAIAKQSGDVERVSEFKLGPVNVISVLEGDVISTTSTDQSIVFERAKAKSSTDSLFELQKINNGFSIAGLAPGVYTLDIIAAKNNAKAAYEGILVIGQNPESQEVKQVVEREITEVDQGTTIENIIPIFQLPPNPPNPQPAPGPLIVQQQQGQQQQQPAAAAIPPGGQAPANQPSPPPTQVPQALAGLQQPPSQQPPPTPAPTAPRGIIPSCILTADCPRSPPPQALAAQQPTPSPSPPPSTSTSTESDNGDEPDPCLIDPYSPECQIVDTFDTPSEDREGEDGTEGTDELARESQDTDGEDSESESESDGDGEGGGEGGGDGGEESE